MVWSLFVYSVSQIEHPGILKSESEEACGSMESFTSMKGACLLSMCRSASKSYQVKIHLISKVDWGGQSDNRISVVSLENYHFHEFYFYNNSRKATRE